MGEAKIDSSTTKSGLVVTKPPSRRRGGFANAIACISLVSTVAWLVPAVAYAAGDGGGASDMIWQAINLVLVLGVLVYFARKPIVEFFAGRRTQIKDQLDSAAELLSQAEARNSEIQRKLVDLQSEVEEIREISRRRAEEESERILAEARKAAERIRSDASAAVGQELQRAQRELRAEAADLALELAGDILREQVGEPDRERLLDEFITRVEPGSSGAN